MTGVSFFSGTSGVAAELFPGVCNPQADRKSMISRHPIESMFFIRTSKNSFLFCVMARSLP
jgi:hypothetical protein